MAWISHYSTCRESTFSVDRRDSQSTLLKSRGSESSTSTSNDSDVFSNDPEFQSALVSVRTGSEVGDAFLSNGYPRRESLQDRPLPGTPYSYNNINRAGAVKDKPAPPPPSYANQGAQRAPPPLPRTYMNGSSSTPSPSLPTTTTKTSAPFMARICPLIVIVMTVISLLFAVAAVVFAVYTYTTISPCHQMQVNEVGDPEGGSPNLTLAHVKLKVNMSEVTSSHIQESSNFTLFISTKGSELRNVGYAPKNLYIMESGWYFVYSSINYNVNIKDGGCQKLQYKTWLHHVMLHRNDVHSNEKSKTALLRTEHTCCTECKEFRTSSFTGGVFYLQTDDMISVMVSAPPLVVSDKESSYLGLFLVDNDHPLRP